MFYSNMQNYCTQNFVKTQKFHLYFNEETEKKLKCMSLLEENLIVENTELFHEEFWNANILFHSAVYRSQIV